MGDVEGQPRGYKMLTTPTPLSSPSSLIHIDQIHLGLPLLCLSQRSSRHVVTDAGMSFGIPPGTNKQDDQTKEWQGLETSGEPSKKLCVTWDAIRARARSHDLTFNERRGAPVKGL